MIDFPNSPTVGNTFVAAGTTYQCTQVSPNVWLGTPASGLGILDAPNDGVQYGRQSKAWTPIASGGNYVLKTGDTMTGALVINQTASPYNATLTLNKAADANSVNVYAQSGGLARWTMVLGSGGAGDFMLLPYADNGVTPNPTPLKIIRATSTVQLPAGWLQWPSVQKPSADPNTLDDYAEGSWTPTNTAGVPMTVNAASYTKIGRMVYIEAQLTIAANSSGANLMFGGVPYAPTATGPLSIGYQNTGLSGAMLTAMINGPAVNIYNQGGFATFAQFSGAQIFFGGWYQAA